MKQDNKPLSVPDINRINNILKQLNAKTIPYNTKAHNAAKKLDTAYIKAHDDHMNNQAIAKMKTKRQQALLQKQFDEIKAKKKTEQSAAGGGGVSLNQKPTMVDQNLMEEQKGIKAMASKLRTKELIKGLTKYKDKQNEEASKKRQAIMAEGQTDLAIREPTPKSGIGKMADADSTVKPKGQVLVEEFIVLKDTDPEKAEQKRKQLQDEFDDEEIN